MGINKKQTIGQTSELTKKDLIEIIKDQISAYDKKQKRERFGSLIAKLFRLLIVGAIVATAAYFTQFAALSEDEEDKTEEDENIDPIN